MIYKRYGLQEIWFTRDMIYKRYDLQEIWFTRDMVYKRYDLQEIWFTRDMIQCHATEQLLLLLIAAAVLLHGRFILSVHIHITQQQTIEQEGHISFKHTGSDWRWSSLHDLQSQYVTSPSVDML
jgi:hypothetical protein